MPPPRFLDISIHNGGGKPLGQQEDKLVAFFTISSDVLDYDQNQCVTASALLSLPTAHQGGSPIDIDMDIASP